MFQICKTCPSLIVVCLKLGPMELKCSCTATYGCLNNFINVWEQFSSVLPLQNAIAQLCCHWPPAKFLGILNKMQLSYPAYTDIEITVVQSFWFRGRNTEFCFPLKTAAALICKTLPVLVEALMFCTALQLLGRWLMGLEKPKRCPFLLNTVWCNF